MSNEMNSIRVKLQMFMHQVSGTTLMFKFDNGTICKPLWTNEYLFYKTLPEDLSEFTARYKGSIEIVCEESADGTIDFYGIVPQEKIESLQLRPVRSDGEDVSSDEGETCVDLLAEHEGHSNDGGSFRLKRSGSIIMDEESLELYHDPSHKMDRNSSLSKNNIKKYFSTPGARTRFILLEDLVAPFSRPSVLDLKMGTRTHADDDPADKMASKSRKAAVSTTRTHGVRLSGMQKFNISTTKYETYNKIDGVRFTGDEFESVVRDFLFDGKRLRAELVQPILERLRKFRQAVNNQDTFRFYSSSLLIIYDGEEADCIAKQGSVDVRCIDFAHTTSSSSSTSNNQNVTTTYTGPDKGYLSGISSLIKIFEHLVQ